MSSPFLKILWHAFLYDRCLEIYVEKGGKRLMVCFPFALFLLEELLTYVRKVAHQG